MKKNYSKPEIVFESFKMSSNIATPCADKISSNESSCGIPDLFGTYFAVGADGSVCTLDADTVDCYDVSANNPGVFGS